VKNSNTINKTKNVKQNSYESDFSTPTNSELPPNGAKKQVDETNKRASESCPAPNNRKTMNHERPNVYKAKLKNSKRKFFSTEKMTESVSQVILAQRIKTNELQNRITQLNDEIEKLRDENKTLKRVHVREEIARKKLETQETDIERLVKNYSEEVTSLKQSIKKLNNDNKKLSTSIMDKEDELRILRKKNEKLNTILNDKNLIESNELRAKLDVCEKELEIQISKYKVILLIKKNC
jgi:chromosome segregation ATPase